MLATEITYDVEALWGEMSLDEQGHFLVLVTRELAHRPLPDPGWQQLVAAGLAARNGGQLRLAPLGVHLMGHLLETHFCWLLQ